MPAILGEFELIERFFKRAETGSPHVVKGVGDDCALLAADANEQWAVSVDTLIEDVHFFADVDPESLGHKSLAVNLSDLAACGATPRCFFLALALPRPDQRWLDSFCRGLYRIADAHGCVLAGGDTTHSHSVAITITVMGTVPRGKALMRSGARAGDDIWISGTLGDAALALAQRRGQVQTKADEAAQVLERLQRPVPRIRLGEQLRDVASSAIDVSDGLVGDLGHVLRASAKGAIVRWTDIPCSAVLRRQPLAVQQQCALGGGDDYELLFTVSPHDRARVIEAAADVAVTCIGSIVEAPGLKVIDDTGAAVDTAVAFDHFRQ